MAAMLCYAYFNEIILKYLDFRVTLLGCFEHSLAYYLYRSALHMLFVSGTRTGC